MGNSLKHFYEFGAFRIDVANRLLLRDGEPLPLTPKAVDTLLVLVRHRGEVLRKDDLMQLVWPDSVVDEGNLTQNIYLLRKTLGEGSNGHIYIETVPRRGYRFVGEAREFEGGTGGVGDGETGGRGEEETRGAGEKENGQPGDDGATALSPRPLVPHPPLPPLAHFSSPSLPRRRWLGAAALAGPVVIVVIATLFYLAFSVKPKPPEMKAAIESIAVLPFRPLGAAGGDEDLGVGLADALITQLSNVRRIVVRPTSAVLKYGGSNQDLMAAGRELNVDALLDGRFQRAGRRLRATVQLVRVRDGAPLWADKFDEEFTDMLAVQDAIAQRVTQALALRLSGEEQRLLDKRFTANPDAYQAYLKGRSCWSRRATPAVEEAIHYFGQALSYDPDYALAWAGLADAYVMLGFRYDSEEQSQGAALPKAKAAATRALQLDDLLAEAHTSLAVVRARYDWDFAGAGSEFRRAIELNPNYEHAHHMYALYLSAMGQSAEAEAEMKRAQELDPLGFSISRGLGDIFFRAREYDRALEQFRRTLKMAPDDPMTFSLHRTMGWAYEYRGLHDQAVAEFIEALRLQNAKAAWLTALRQAYDAGGMKGYWRRWLELQQERVGRGRLSPFYLAQIHAFLGEKDQAFAYLQKACEDRSIVLPALRSGPNFDDLRADSRYATLLQRIGLTP
ncbi:MAG TPA: winged helix-turn-helix domain-containing protein [Blastocatellia bacterium]|nr:winged helix-turn-helix domain-containing protein [Blastocatellia bacterium]